MAFDLPNLAVVTAFSSRFRGRWAHYVTEPEEERGYVSMLATDVFDPTAKIEIERSTDRGLVHLRFCSTNRYWACHPVSGRIFAGSIEKDEDTSRPTCTLFEPVFFGANSYFLRFVPNGKRVKAIHTDQSFGQLVLDDNDSAGEWDEMYQRFSFTNWDTLVKLPKHVAFKGHNDKYLRTFLFQPDQLVFLQFSSDEVNELETAYEVIQEADGRVQIKSVSFDRFWSGNSSWILVHSATSGGRYWPVKLNNSTIALRSGSGNNVRFCRSLTDSTMTDCLSASASTIVREARLAVKELILERQIKDVVYDMDNARIYDQRAVVAGTGRSTNNTQEEASQTISVSFTDESSYSFSNSQSLSTGVTTTITATLGRVFESNIEWSSEETVSAEMGEEVSRSVSAEASYTAVVPPMSTIIVHYVAREGKCDIPFSYVQRDRSSSDGSFLYSNHRDGVYTGANYYSFHFDQPDIRRL